MSLLEAPYPEKQPKQILYKIDELIWPRGQVPMNLDATRPPRHSSMGGHMAFKFADNPTNLLAMWVVLGRRACPPQ
jgi:hypothetical protein